MTAASIVAEAIKITHPTERAQFIDRACAGMPMLRNEVEELLAGHDAHRSEVSVQGDLENTGAYVPGHHEARHATKVGDRVGPFKLLERIGEGGMGEVWVADQLEPIKRRVALKLIKPGMDSRGVLARFEAERQALAVMDHPNIAKVLDAGTTSDGRPYFVMELVKGTPITEFCDARKLTPQERLELFIPVCQAIQHAHIKGIIHRDIKPSNVMVALHDGIPVPKVIDFGVAKAIGQQLTDKTIYTGFGALVGTPAYMAPEQATFNQLDIDTRADVYSLGVLLYELLAGSPPIEKERLKKAAIDEVLRIVRDEEPPRPSQRLSTSETRASIAATRQTEPAKLFALMKGELDWIVMKALEKDRTRRYETATNFAADIQRYLTGEPVQAVPPSLSYRMRKAYRRNKVMVLTAGVVSLVLILGIVGTTSGMIWALRAERDARSASQAETEQRKLAEAATKVAQTAESELRAEFEAAVDDLIDKRLYAPRTEDRLPELSPDERPYYERLRDYFAHQAKRLTTKQERTAAHVRVGTVCTRMGDFAGARDAFDAAANELRADHSSENRLRLIDVLVKYRTACDLLAARFTQLHGEIERQVAILGGGPVLCTRMAEFVHASAMTDELITTAEILARNEPSVAAHHLQVARFRFERIAQTRRYNRHVLGRLDARGLPHAPPPSLLGAYEQDLRAGLAAYRSAIELTPHEASVLHESNAHLKQRVLLDRFYWLSYLTDAAIADIVAEWMTVRIKAVHAANYPPWAELGGTAFHELDTGFAATILFLDEHLTDRELLTDAQFARRYRTRILEPLSRAVQHCPEYRYAAAILVAGQLKFARRMRYFPDQTVAAEEAYREALRLATEGTPLSPYNPAEPLRDYARAQWIQTLCSLPNHQGVPDAWKEMQVWQRELEAEKPTPAPNRLSRFTLARLNVHNHEKPEDRGTRSEELITTLKLLAGLPSAPAMNYWDRVRSNVRNTAAILKNPSDAEQFITKALNAVREGKPKNDSGYASVLFDLHRLRGALYYEQNRNLEAVEDVEAALTVGKDLRSSDLGLSIAVVVATLRLQAGHAYVRLKKFTEAETMFAEGWEPYRAFMEDRPRRNARPDYTKMLLAIAQEYYNAGRHSDAALWFERAAVPIRLLRQENLPWAKSLAPSLCHPWAVSLYVSNQPKQAIRVIDELNDLLITNHRASALILRARCQAQLGDHLAGSAGAKEFLARGGERYPFWQVFDAASCYAYCAMAVKSDNDLKTKYGDEAVRLLRVCAKIDPKNLAGAITFGDFNAIRDRADFQQLADELKPK